MTPKFKIGDRIIPKDFEPGEMDICKRKITFVGKDNYIYDYMIAGVELSSIDDKQETVEDVFMLNTVWENTQSLKDAMGVTDG